MQKFNFPNGLLIVLELGAEWPSWVQAELGVWPAPARRVLVQEQTESSAAFAARVGELLGGAFARSGVIGSAVIACSERLDAVACGARRELARAAADALARGSGGRLILAASDRNEGRSRPALGALARQLGVEWQSAAVDIRLHFAGEPEALSVSPRTGAGARRARAKDNARRVA